MNRYKKFLLFSATALLFVGGTVAADEVGETSNQEQTVMVAVKTDNQSTMTNQEVSQSESKENQIEQTPTVSDENSQVQELSKKQEEASVLNNQVVQNQGEQGVAQQNQQTTEVETNTSAVTESDSQEGRDNPDVSTEEYEANVAELKPVTMADVYHMFEDKDGSYTLYLGRPTCIYCRKFSPVVKDFNILTNGEVYYYNTDSSDFTPVAKEFLRNKIGFFATPTVLRLEKGQIVSGQLGSGGTAQELYEKVYPEKITAENAVTPTETVNNQEQSNNASSTIPAKETNVIDSSDNTKVDKKLLVKITNKVLRLVDKFLTKLNY